MRKGISGCFFCGRDATESLLVECGNNAELGGTVDMCGPCFDAFEADEDGFRERNAEDFETIQNELARALRPEQKEKP